MVNHQYLIVLTVGTCVFMIFVEKIDVLTYLVTNLPKDSINFFDLKFTKKKKFTRKRNILLQR